MLGLCFFFFFFGIGFSCYVQVTEFQMGESVTGVYWDGNWGTEFMI